VKCQNHRLVRQEDDESDEWPDPFNPSPSCTRQATYKTEPLHTHSSDPDDNYLGLNVSRSEHIVLVCGVHAKGCVKLGVEVQKL
jgi:hypothetical protein